MVSLGYSLCRQNAWKQWIGFGFVSLQNNQTNGHPQTKEALPTQFGLGSLAFHSNQSFLTRIYIMVSHGHLALGFLSSLIFQVKKLSSYQPPWPKQLTDFVVVVLPNVKRRDQRLRRV